MKNTTVIIITIVILILIGGGAYVMSQLSSSSSENTNGDMMKEDADNKMMMDDSSNDHMDEESMMEDKSSDDKMMNDDDSMMEEDDSSMEKDDAMMMDDDSMMSSTSKYVTYSPSALSDNADKKRVLFFYASWCPTCKPADADFSAHADQIPDGVAVIRVNYNDPETDDDEKALAQKYGVTYQHTYVQIDSQGNPVTKWNGGQLKELLASIK